MYYIIDDTHMIYGVASTVKGAIKNATKCSSRGELKSEIALGNIMMYLEDPGTATFEKNKPVPISEVLAYL